MKAISTVCTNCST